MDVSGRKTTASRISLRHRGFCISCLLLMFLLLWAEGGRTRAAEPDGDGEVIFRFDFGKESCEEGCLAVASGLAYSPELGYGFAHPEMMKDVGAPGDGALSDAVRFADGDPANTFDVDLPVGLYELRVTLGETKRTSIRAEDCLQIINMTGDNAFDSVCLPVTDGQLNIMAVQGKEDSPYTLSALEIRKVSDDPNPGPVLWICGDSTACNYYPIGENVQGGWGEMLGSFLPEGEYMIRNMSAGGAYAESFLEGGFFDVVERFGKEGDLCLICFGINDVKYSSREDYYKAVTGMVRRAKAKGMTAAVVKPQATMDQILREEVPERAWGGGELDRVGEQEHVQVIDLFTQTLRDWRAMSRDELEELFMKDDPIHLTRKGAQYVAELAARELSGGLMSADEGA